MEKNEVQKKTESAATLTRAGQVVLAGISRRTAAPLRDVEP